jgi:hypothetical protein
MSTYVLVGHGVFSPSAGGYPPQVLLPPNTTVKFYSEAGQALAIPTKDDVGSFVEEIAPAWKQLKERTEASPSQGVVYNLTLRSLDSPEEIDAANAAAGTGPPWSRSP